MLCMKRLRGIPGVFSTKILYVIANRYSAERTDYQLVYADMDGRRAVTVLRSGEPILAPQLVAGWQKNCLCFL